MQKDTKNKKRIASVICAGVVILLLLVYLIVFLFPILSGQIGDGAAITILIVFALSILALIVGIVIALFQRLKEIKGGEEDVAAKY